MNRYDAEGLRYELEENGRLVQFIFHQSEVITEQNETDTIRLIRGYDLIASDAQSARTYYHYASDELGSTTHIIDEKGKVLNRYVYDAFGNITEQEETVPNRFKFNGQQFDPITQQYYLRARFYNPVVARFTQEDVYRGDGLNLYAYCHNNPVIYADPNGYSCITGEDLIAGPKAAGNNGETLPDGWVRDRYQELRKANPYLTAEQALSIARNEAAGNFAPALPAGHIMSFNEFEHSLAGKGVTDFSSAYATYLSRHAPPNHGEHYLSRPYLRVDVVSAIEQGYGGARDIGGELWYYDPIAAAYVPGPYDIGHKVSSEFATMRAAAEVAGLTQSQFNDLVNDPALYFVQNRTLNQSHIGELKPGETALLPQQIQQYQDMAQYIIQERLTFLGAKP